MKKYYVFLPILVVCFLFAGCNVVSNIEALMSEKTEIYFYGESDNLSASISVGKRENPYIIDGVHNGVVGFSLITLSVDAYEEDQIEINLSINGQNKKVLLELNPLNMSYMGDLGYVLDKNASVQISYGEYAIEMSNISKSFVVGYKEAIQIGFEQIEEISSFETNGKLSCEGYLKIFDGSKFGGDGLYWCFTLIGQNNSSKNILINTMDKNDVFVG